MITFIPHRTRQYSPREIKEGIKNAYYEIKKEEAERALRERIDKEIKTRRERIERDFEEAIADILMNDEEIEF